MTPRLLGVGGGRRLGLDVARPTRAGGLLLLPLLRVAPLEALDAATRVEELLLARIERVAVRADLDAEVALRASGLEGVPAGAVDRRDLVIGVRVRLHVISPSRRPPAPRTPPRPAAFPDCGASCYEEGAFAISLRNCSFDFVWRIL